MPQEAALHRPAVDCTDQRTLKLEIADLAAKLVACTNGSKPLQDQNNELQAQTLGLTTENVALKIENANQAKKILELTNELNLLKASNNQLRVEISTLTKAVIDEQKRCASTDQQIKVQREAYAQLVQQIFALFKDLLGQVKPKCIDVYCVL